MLKILHTADWHVRDKDIDEISDCLEFLLHTASKEKVGMVIIAGDIFDSRDIKLDSKSAKLVTRIISDLSKICPIDIITGTPSHDGLASESLAALGKNICVTAGAMPQQVIYPGEAVVSLFPTITKQYDQSHSSIAETNVEISQRASGLFAGYGARASYFPDVPHILVGHWNVSGSKLPTGNMLIGQEIDISTDQMMLACPDLICLGHIHIAQKLGDRTFFSGPIYPTTIAESGPNGFYIHTLVGKELVSSEFIKTPHIKRCRVIADYTTDPLPEQCEEYAYQFVSEIVRRECAGANVRSDFTAWQDEAKLIPQAEINRIYLEAGAAKAEIRLIRVPRQTVRGESVLKAQTLRDKLVTQAAIKDETVPERILLKADILEAGKIDEVVGRAA